ncbi:MAG: DUF308 domain-containing protein [Clostridia bacterium]|nr:DUF308 domain-containing protein [Clostridia bacterium]
MSGNTKSMKTFKREVIIINGVIIVLGLLVAIFPETSRSVIGYVVGAVLTALGIIRTIMYFTESKFQIVGSFALVQGTVLLVFGIYFLVKPEFLATIMTAIFAVILIVGGVMKIQYAVDLLRFKFRYWWIELIIAALMIVLGIITFANPFEAEKALMIYVGISLMVNGILDIISILYISSIAQRAKEAVDETGIADGNGYIESTVDEADCPDNEE